MHATQRGNRYHQVQNLLFAIGGRLIIGYLLFKTIGSRHSVETASVGTELDNSADSCSSANIQTILSYGGAESNKQSAEILYRHCAANFLDKNQLEPEVKGTVDDWLQMDLSSADATEMFSAYQLAIQNQKPTINNSKFEDSCKRMHESYDSFMDLTAPLTDYIGLDIGSQLANEGQINNNERKLLNYAMYSQFCHLIISN